MVAMVCLIEHLVECLVTSVCLVFRRAFHGVLITFRFVWYKAGRGSSGVEH